MKALLFTFFAAMLAVTACNNQGTKSEKGNVLDTATAGGHYPVMTFEKQLHDFGNVTEGEVVEYSFKFTNTGEKDLLINNAEASCGCTVPEWPKEPIKPGESGYMKVKFDSKGRPEGHTEKELYIQANTNPPMMNGPRIQCMIVKKK
ncbi:DUF1573 domain-containing protein [Chitinophaga niabensis]|uniref:DUF1573 domain-containing protein n=1 Tax=Chitinophaga niabensis TaxID=536979 RepID=A0A1N6FU40_9BACT|nr:DUF1573 domain-containing protein [Chitinophaga niabensis]SIN98866.1 Protein of unknown function [Chitinophaga niabensis]